MGERFTDKNGNGRWDVGEPFEDDAANTSLDRRADQKYDGIYLAGFGNDRLATGKHDDLWARALVLEQGGAHIGEEIERVSKILGSCLAGHGQKEETAKPLTAKNPRRHEM